MSVFLVVGVHGVGKTTACAAVSKAIGIQHYTASEIIRAAETSAISPNTKRVADVDRNQRLLVDGINRLAGDAPLLLDGHLTLHTNQGTQAIPLHVFEELRIRAIIIFTDAAERIVARMKDRDGRALPVKSVRFQQSVELEHASVVARALNVPLVRLAALDLQGLQKVILELL